MYAPCAGWRAAAPREMCRCRSHRRCHSLPANLTCLCISEADRQMARTIAYWITTGLVGLALLGSLTYLTGNEQVVSGFAKAGYPQHLRIVLGMAKPAAAIVLLLPGLALLKEWAYAGASFAWIMAFI